MIMLFSFLLVMKYFANTMIAGEETYEQDCLRVHLEKQMYQFSLALCLWYVPLCLGYFLTQNAFLRERLLCLLPWLVYSWCKESMPPNWRRLCIFLAFLLIWWFIYITLIHSKWNIVIATIVIWLWETSRVSLGKGDKLFFFCIISAVTNTM